MLFPNQKMWGPDSERVRAAARITGPDRVGVIDGVEVDFRCSSIDPAEWEPRPWWHFASDSQGSARLRFPSDDEFSVPAMKGAIALGTGDAVRAIDASTDEAGAAFLAAFPAEFNSLGGDHNRVDSPEDGDVDGFPVVSDAARQA